MENIIELLEEKNHFLEKFSNLNVKQLEKIEEGNLDDLDHFYNSRERLLKILNQIDFMIEQQTSIEFRDDISDQNKKQVLRTFDRKNELVNEILSQDLQILSFIEETKSQIIKDLSELKQGKKVISAYKSGNSK